MSLSLTGYPNRPHDAVFFIARLIKIRTDLWLEFRMHEHLERILPILLALMSFQHIVMVALSQPFSIDQPFGLLHRFLLRHRIILIIAALRLLICRGRKEHDSRYS